jgi:hypothetical protein
LIVVLYGGGEAGSEEGVENVNGQGSQPVEVGAAVETFQGHEERWKRGGDLRVERGWDQVERDREELLSRVRVVTSL